MEQKHYKGKKWEMSEGFKAGYEVLSSKLATFRAKVDELNALKEELEAMKENLWEVEGEKMGLDTVNRSYEINGNLMIITDCGETEKENPMLKMIQGLAKKGIQVPVH